MEHATYASRLRYLDADDVDDSTVDFDGLEVRGRDDAKLGDIDGFIVDETSGQVHYIVVDSGGWFTSRRFLLPVGHATLDTDAGALRVDVNQDAIRRYPEFDEGRFKGFSDEDLRAFEQRTAAACCPGDTLEDATAGSWRSAAYRHFSQPVWWGGAYPVERLRPVEVGADSDTPVRELHDTERVVAHERDGRRLGSQNAEERREPSPHYEGRAQPGDVLGLETGGERTYIGDTAEDENERRLAAEEATREASDTRNRKR
jgi:PRC-barrel domain protein